jgi:hypothetical protein
MEIKELKKIHRDRRHDHYWIEDGVIFETYETIRGLRYRELYYVPDMPDNDRCDDDCITYIEKEFLNK